MTTQVIGFNGSDLVFNKVNRRTEYGLFYDANNNNLLVINALYKSDTVDIPYIVDYTDPVAFKYLVNLLENNKDIVVEWYKCEGVTSDYYIHYGLNVAELIAKSNREVSKLLRNRRINDVGMKFQAVDSGGKCTAIEL